ncbi:MAG: YhjD/YihY/BrkB family envelope integrity protein [Nitriliruptoraceae bacterium]
MKERLASLPVIGTALAVQERYKADAADPLAAAIGFFGFLSLFPLLLLAVSAAGFILDDPAAQVAIAEQITEAIPGFEQTVDDEGGGGVQELVAGVVEQRGTIGLVGGVVLLLSGLRVVNGAMIASRVVFRGEVLKGVAAKGRQLLALVALGLLALGGVVASGIAGSGLGDLPAAASLLVSVAVTFVLDVLLFLGAYLLLAPTATLTTRERLPGALLAAAGWTLLKVAGASYVGNQVDSANALYGALGGVIALLLLLYLGGRLYLYGAELSAVRYERVHGPLIAPHHLEALGVDEAASVVGGPRGTVDGDADGTADGDAAGDQGVTGERGGDGDDGDDGDDEGPPPIPRAAWLLPPDDPGPGRAAPTVSPATRARLAAGDAPGAVPGDGVRGPGRDLRTAAGFALAIGSLVAGWRYLGDRTR